MNACEPLDKPLDLRLKALNLTHPRQGSIISHRSQAISMMPNINNINNNNNMIVDNVNHIGNNNNHTNINNNDINIINIHNNNNNNNVGQHVGFSFHGLHLTDDLNQKYRTNDHHSALRSDYEDGDINYKKSDSIMDNNTNMLLIDSKSSSQSSICSNKSLGSLDCVNYCSSNNKSTYNPSTSSTTSATTLTATTTSTARPITSPNANNAVNGINALNCVLATSPTSPSSPRSLATPTSPSMIDTYNFTKPTTTINVNNQHLIQNSSSSSTSSLSLTTINSGCDQIKDNQISSLGFNNMRSAVNMHRQPLNHIEPHPSSRLYPIQSNQMQSLQPPQPPPPPPQPILFRNAYNHGLHQHPQKSSLSHNQHHHHQQLHHHSRYSPPTSLSFGHHYQNQAHAYSHLQPQQQLAAHSTTLTKQHTTIPNHHHHHNHNQHHSHHNHAHQHQRQHHRAISIANGQHSSIVSSMALHNRQNSPPQSSGPIRSMSIPTHLLSSPYQNLSSLSSSLANIAQTPNSLTATSHNNKTTQQLDNNITSANRTEVGRFSMLLQDQLTSATNNGQQSSSVKHSSSPPTSSSQQQHSVRSILSRTSSFSGQNNNNNIDMTDNNSKRPPILTTTNGQQYNMTTSAKTTTTTTTTTGSKEPSSPIPIPMTTSPSISTQLTSSSSLSPSQTKVTFAIRDDENSKSPQSNNNNQQQQSSRGSSRSSNQQANGITRQTSLVSRYNCKPCGIVFSQPETLKAHQEGYCTKRENLIN